MNEEVIDENECEGCGLSENDWCEMCGDCECDCSCCPQCENIEEDCVCHE